MGNNQGSNWKETALFEAVETGDMRRVQAVMKRTPVVNATNKEGNTPIMIATASGNTELMKFLVGVGALIDYQNQEGETALYKAIRSGSKVALSLLLTLNADTTLFNQDYETALHCAVRQGDLWMTQKLIQTSCAIDAKNKAGKTAVFIAVELNFTRIAEALINAGADVNTADDFGDTCLMAAARLPSYSAARSLLQAGADTRAVDNAGKFVFEHAADNTMRGILEGTPVGANTARNPWLREKLYDTDPTTNTIINSATPATLMRMSEQDLCRCEHMLVHHQRLTSANMFAAIPPAAFNRSFLNSVGITALGTQQVLLDLHDKLRIQQPLTQHQQQQPAGLAASTSYYAATHALTSATSAMIAHSSPNANSDTNSSGSGSRKRPLYDLAMTSSDEEEEGEGEDEEEEEEELEEGGSVDSDGDSTSTSSASSSASSSPSSDSSSGSTDSHNRGGAMAAPIVTNGALGASSGVVSVLRHTTAASKRPRLSQNHQQQQALRIPLLARKATSSSESTSTSSFQSSDSASSTSSDSRSDASDDSSTTSSGSAQGLAAPGRSFSSGPTSSAAGAATETTATTTPSGLPPLGASYATGARLAQDLFSTRRSSAELTDRAASAAQTTATQASATALFPPPAQRQPEQQCTPAVHLHGQQLRPISPAPKRPRHQQQLGSVRATPTHMQDLDLDFVAAPTIPVGGDVPLPHPETSYFQQFRNLQAKAGSSSNNRSGTGGGGCAGMKDRLADEREKERESERNSTRSEQWFPSHHLFDPTAHSAPPCPDMMGLLDDTLRTIKQRLQSESRNGGGGEEWSEGEMQAVEQQREVSGDTTAASGLDDVPVQWKIERGGHTLLDEDENEKEAPGSLFLPTGTGVNVEAEVEAEDVAAGNSYRSNAVDRVDAVCDTAMPSSASSASSPIIHPVSRRRRHRTGTLHESDSNLSLADAAATTIASTAAATFNTTAAAVASAHYISSMYDITITDITKQSPSPAQQQQSIGQGNVGYFTHAGVGEEEDEDHEDNVSPFSFHGSRAEDRFSTVDSEAPAAVDAAVAAAEYEVKSEGGNGCDGDGDNMVRDRNQGGEEGVEEEDFVFWMQDEDGVYYQADSAGNLM